MKKNMFCLKCGADGQSAESYCKRCGASVELLEPLPREAERDSK